MRLPAPAGSGHPSAHSGFTKAESLGSQHKPCCLHHPPLAEVAPYAWNFLLFPSLFFLANFYSLFKIQLKDSTLGPSLLDPLCRVGSGVPFVSTLLLLPSRFSRVRLCATPETAAHQAPPSLGFSRQEHWSGLPLPSKVKSLSRV